jgi:predicted TPR repeat methyltransferase
MSVDDAISTAMQLHKQGELLEARTLYSDILRVVPKHPDALHYIGVAMHQLGDSEEGIAHIQRSLELSPDHPDALNNLGNVYREIGRYEASETLYKKVLEIAPEHTDTLVNIGIILRGLKRPEDALVMLEKALAIDPEHARAHHNLGNVYRDLERYDEALTAYSTSERLDPLDGNSARAIAKLLYLQGRHDDAAEVLKALIERKPDDAQAIHELAAYTGEDVPKRAADRYICQTFDHYALSFDESLARLKYKAPKLISSRVIDRLGGSRQKYRVLDIGCGTGLCGPLIKPIAEHLVGVDLSRNMLKQAQKRGVYDQLEEAELTAYMNSAEAGFDVVICVDTFVYFGDLGDGLRAASHTLHSDGWLFFTVEKHNPDEHDNDYWLQLHGRYSHTRDYVEHTLEDAGFDVSALDDVVLRMEHGKPVDGILAVARKI